MGARVVAAAALFAPLLSGCGGVLARVEPPPPPTAPAAEPVVSARARYQYLVGRLALAKGDLAGAEQALRTALLHDPAAPEPWLALADVAEASGDEVEERRRAQEAARLAPDRPEAWTRLGRIAERDGDTRAAVDAYRSATERGGGADAWAPYCRLLLKRNDPQATAAVRAWGAAPLTDPELLRERGHMRLVVGDLEGAVADLGEVLVRSPGDARLLDEFLTAVTGSGLYRQGLARLALLHRAAPRDTEVLLRTYHLAAQARDQVRAAAALEALDALLGGREAQVKLWLADAYGALGRHDEALAALDAAARATPPLADAAYHRARLLRAAGRSARALDILAVPASGANRPDALALQARLLVDVGRAGDARAAIEAALRGLPDDYVLLGALVTVSAAEGDRAAMLAAVDRMAMLDPEARARTRARSLAGLGDVDAALVALRATGPEQAESWIVGGSLLREAGRVEEAIDWLARGVDRHPRHAGLRAELGLARAAARQAEDALVAMREALQLDPTEARAARFYGRAVADAPVAERLEQARGHVLAALERQPADAELLAVLGRVEYALNQPLRAVEAWEEACRYARPDADLLARMAAVYREVGRPEAARLLEERYRR